VLFRSIGNPPFGHAGEEVIRHWFSEDTLKLKTQIPSYKMKDLTCFDGNAMSFHVVTYAEYYISSGGMRLTYPTLGALLKYPWTSDYCGKKKKFSCLKADVSTLKNIADTLGLLEIKEGGEQYAVKYARHPLAYLVEAADDICYKILDIEDAIELKYLPCDFFDTKFKQLLVDNGTDISGDNVLENTRIANRTKNAYIRGKVIGILTEEAKNAFIKNYDDIMTGNFTGALCDDQQHNVFETLNSAFESIRNDVFTTKRKAILESGAYSSIGNILETFAKAACDLSVNRIDDISYKTQKIKDLLGSNIPQDFKPGDQNKRYELLVIMLEYICGMTDHYATEFNRKILGLGS
jgi:dGTPase